MDYAADILKFAAGAVTGWFAHLLAGRRDAKNRVRKAKDEFLSVVASQAAALDALPRHEFKHFNPKEDVVFKETVEAMTAAVYHVQPYLSAKERTCLTSVLSDYQGHKERYTGLTRRGLDLQSGVSFMERLQVYMKRFEECIRK